MANIKSKFRSKKNKTKDRMDFYHIAKDYFASESFINLSRASKDKYKRILDGAHDFLYKDIREITRHDITEYIAHNQKFPGRVRNMLSVLQVVFRHAEYHGIIPMSPIPVKKYLKKSTPIQAWTRAQIAEVIDGAPYHLERTIATALYTGQRASDLVRLRQDDYDGQWIGLTQQKTGQPLVIAVHPRLKEILDREKCPRDLNPYLLWNSHGDPWSVTAIKQAISRTVKSKGLSGLSIHGLRKSAAAQLAEHGATTKQIASITGHKTLREIERYTQGADRRKMSEDAIRIWR